MQKYLVEKKIEKCMIAIKRSFSHIFLYKPSAAIKSAIWCMLTKFVVHTFHNFAYFPTLRKRYFQCWVAIKGLRVLNLYII